MFRQFAFVAYFALSVSFVFTATAADSEFTLANDSCCGMTSASISPAGQQAWTEVLQSQTLAPSAKIAIPYDNAQCVWDIVARFDDGTSGTLSGADLCSSGGVTFHD